MGFSLFRREEIILEQARQLVSEKKCNPEEIKECLLTLIDALNRCYREQKCLIRVSDRQQEQLRTIKEELLAKTVILEHQAAELKAFNKNLASEIAIRKKVEKELRVMANTDGLTGINNRRRFLELLENEVKRSKRTGETFCLMILDLDHFKRINDHYGHAVGDQVLSHVANVLLSNIREIDEAGRVGGEEFGILLPGTSVQNAFTLAKRLCLTLESQKIIIPGKTINITVSIGVAEFKKGESGDQLIVRADTAMYAAKQNGRNRVEMA